MGSLTDPASSLAPISAAVGALKDVKHPAVRRAITTYSLGLAAYTGYRSAKNWWQSRSAYTVSIDSREELFMDIQEWLLRELPLEDIRSMYATKKRGAPRYNPDTLDFETAATDLILYYDGSVEQSIEIDGHNIRVAVNDNDKGDEKDKTFVKRTNVRFTATSPEGQKAVTNKLRELAVVAEVEQKSPRFMMANKWGEWVRRNDLEARSLDTVILPQGQKETLIDDIGQFLRFKERYLKFGIPYHRGYLFEGPPGTGKTSLAKALATHFKLDVYYIPLADMEKDTSLLTMIAAVPAGSVLLLEDVDVFHASRERDADTQDFGITLSGLLNSLDGVSTPSGLITIMTTNRIEVLDDAIVRPGRVDRIEHIGYLNDDQLHQLVFMFLGHNDFKLPALGAKQVAPAEVAELVKRDLEEPELAFKHLRKFLKKK